ncbi:helix-turn-helix domain-containing protein [Fictibacillus enclensis]|uniref:helix-turn-helix domain-containing protein n=1 Tax=Fictibacillus enclensis TaxID=1017270 RepID=UPI0024BF563F|nr:helix-turn-helix transcriptional regulator [Fictibacillus enclensis]WHY72045.1 helix-turn-helix transcriptional regulator [Fictibacillus enclensis]
MSIGRIIYYHRRKQNKTQEQLCQGICSVTHLSKIENNVKDANPKTLQLLCERLNISTEEENRKSDQVSRLLETFFDSMERLQKDSAQQLYKVLEKQKDYIQCTEMIYLYELYRLRYMLMTNELGEFEKTAQQMRKYQSKFSPFELFLWDFLQGVYHGQRQQFTQALAIHSRNEQKAELYHTKVTDYYYYLSAVHGHLYHYSLSIHYAYKALRVYQNSNNLLRIVYVKMILAVNFIFIGEYEKSYEMLQLILRDAEQLKDREIRSLAYHNLGFLYFRREKMKESLDNYAVALKIKEPYSSSYYVTVACIAETLISDHQHEKAAALLKKELNRFQDEKSPQFIELKILYLEALGNQKALINYLTKDGLAVLQKYSSFTRGFKYLEMISSFYEEQKDYEKANHFLRLSTKHMKNLLFNIGSPIEPEKELVKV